MKKLILIILSINLLFGGCISVGVNEKEAKKLAQEFYEHPEITEMDDCTRARKYINDIRITMVLDSTEYHSSITDKPIFYKRVLSTYGIQEKDFEYFKGRLNETGLRHYYRKGNFSVFITGGNALGDIEGILVVDQNGSIPDEGFRLNEHHYIWIGKKIEENVYWIS